MRYTMSYCCDEYEAYILWKYGEIEEEQEEETPYDAFEPDPDEGYTTDEDVEMLGYCAIDFHESD